MASESTLVDTNVLLDLLGEDPEWFEWSFDALALALDSSLTVLNPVVLAELSVGYASPAAVDQVLEPFALTREALPFAAAFPAAQAFVAYRGRGGTRSSTLPDFLIGAHAAVAGHTLLTRDARRYRTYFPDIRIVAPH